MCPGTTKAWVTPPPAETPRQLVVQGGLVVDDGRVRQLERRTGQLGFDNLRSYLQTRCDTGHSIPALAQELGVSEWTVTQTLGTLGIMLPPRPERLARQRRRYAEERIAARVAKLGFAEVQAYMEDRLLKREWLLVDVAAELAADRRTIRRLMQQAGVQRRRRTLGSRPSASGAGRCKRSPGRYAGRRGWPSWASAIYPVICRPAMSSSDGRSNSCGRSFGLAATGWWRRWHGSVSGDDGCQLTRPLPEPVRIRSREPAGGHEAAGCVCSPGSGRLARNLARSIGGGGNEHAARRPGSSGGGHDLLAASALPLAPLEHRSRGFAWADAALARGGAPAFSRNVRLIRG
jgi:hypothetical protein